MIQTIMGALTAKDVLTAAPRLLDSAAKLFNLRSGGRKDDAVAKLIQQVVKDQTVLARELQEASDRVAYLDAKLKEASTRTTLLTWGLLVSSSVAIAAIVLSVLL